MDSTEKISPENSPSRRKFVWGVGILSVFAAIAAATGIHFPGKSILISANLKTVREQ